MIDTAQPVRKAFFDALNGNITYNSVNVPVYDEQSTGTVSNYIILSTQTSNDTDTLTSFQSDNTILLDIVSKTPYSVSKNIVDNIANQVFLLLKPAPQTIGLTAPSGLTFSVLKVQSDNHLSFTISSETVMRRLIRFSLKVNQ